MIATGTGVGAAATAQLGLLQANQALQIGAIGITSAAQIAAIVSAKKNSSVQASSSNAGGGSGASLPSYGGAAPALATPQIQASQQATPGQQIAETLSATTNRPIRAFVVSSDISSQQQMDRKSNRGATFNLG